MAVLDRTCTTIWDRNANRHIGRDRVIYGLEFVQRRRTKEEMWREGQLGGGLQGLIETLDNHRLVDSYVIGFTELHHVQLIVIFRCMVDAALVEQFQQHFDESK